MIDQHRMRSTIIFLLDELGLDLKDEAFRETPERVARFWQEFRDREAPKIKVFPSSCNTEIRLNEYQTWGLCPHHLLPVHYTVSISYVPDGKVFGISKLPRIVDYMLRTLPLQEDLPSMIIDYLFEQLDVLTASCSVTGMHLCMTMRGVKAKDCTLTTYASRVKGDQVCQVTK